MKLPAEIKRRLRDALKEDTGAGDRTSALLIPKAACASAVVLAREAGVFSGEAAARELVRIADPGLRLRFGVRDGRTFAKGRVLIRLQGRARSILALERTLLNLLGRLCGIATRTRAFVRRSGGCVRILDTRKTTPLWRHLEKKAVHAGGGENHRMGLYDALLVKENHRLQGRLKRLKTKPRGFEIEVRNLRELAQALKLRPKAILFDNFRPPALKRAVRTARASDRRVILEASGGITLENVRRFARTGVDQISIGSLTHSVSSVDLSLLMRRQNG